MSDFNERARAFELSYAHDQEILFKAHARRDRLFGTWVSERLGHSPEESVEYIRSIIQYQVNQPNPSKLIRKVSKDLDDAGIQISDHQLELKLEAYQDEAMRQIMADIH